LPSWRCHRPQGKEPAQGRQGIPRWQTAYSGYVTVDAAKFSGTFNRLPERNELPKDINEAQIIEYYNRLL
jgi:ribosomal protein S4